MHPLRWLPLFIALGTSAVKADSCRVLDPDIGRQYSGECQGGLAHGVGVAKGVDEYRGEFKAGRTHGRGIYRWSDGSSFEGYFADDGMGDGFGTFREPLKVHRPERKVSPVKGRIVGGEYVEQGYWQNGRLMRDCRTEEACAQAIALEESNATKGVLVGTCASSAPLLSTDEAGRYLGDWRGKWDNQWAVLFTVRSGTSPNHFVVTYYWEEVVGKPMSKRMHAACILDRRLVVDAGFLELSLQDVPTGSAVLTGRFATERRARLTKDN